MSLNINDRFMTLAANTDLVQGLPFDLDREPPRRKIIGLNESDT